MTETTGWNEPEPGTDVPPATAADAAAPQPAAEPEPAPEPEPEPDPLAPDIPAGQPDWLAREFRKIHERLTALEG